MITRRQFLIAGSTVSVSIPALTLGGTQVWAEPVPETLRVGMSNQRPYSFLDEKGQIAGQSFEVLQAALRDAGVKTFEPVVVDFNGLIPGLVAKRFDVVCSAVYVRKERCAQITFGNPDSLSRTGAVTLAGNPKNLKSLVDVAKASDTKVGILRGAVTDTYLTAAGIPQSQWTVLPDVQTLFAAVKSGRIDIGVDALQIMADTANAMNDASIEVVGDFADPIVDGHPAINYAAGGFRKDDMALIAAYNAGLAKLVESGELVEINGRWGIPAALTPKPGGRTSEEVCSG